MSRFVVGIDLGTTNSALAYVDRQSGRWATRIRLLQVPQMVAPFEMRPRPLLPSAIYLAGEHDLPPGALDLPFGEPRPDTVGELARVQGARVPGRLIHSAKSWLCYDRVDRRAPILPWDAAPGCPKLSPMHAAARILFHLREAWNHMLGQRTERRMLDQQDVVITVPASFDAVARELTVQAARAIGIGSPVLVEEPQAALYAWVGAHEADLAERLPVGSRVLVVDIGGGTTDLTVVSVEAGADASEDLRLRRDAVSDHLLLGGDNMDLALSELLAPRLEGSGPLQPADWHALRFAVRDAKERLLEAGAPEAAPVAIAGRGAKLVATTRSTTLGREEAVDAVVERFFPLTDLADASPQRGQVPRRGAALPLAADEAVTRHLGAFLKAHAPPGTPILRPTAVLFNGGVMRCAALRERVLEQLERWTGARPPQLESVGFDLAVARGAAYYGLVRRGAGIRIWSGVARGYYVGVDTPDGKRAALCVIPRGLEPEREVIVDPGLSLQANIPVQLPLFASSVREDAAGALLTDPRIESDREEGDLRALPPLVTVLPSGRKRAARRKEIPIELRARLTEVGVLALACRAKDESDRSWDLELAVRAPVEVDEQKPAAPALAEEALAATREAISAAFAGRGGAHGLLPGLARRLEEIVDEKREAWSVAVCRAIYEPVVEQAEARQRSPDHEARFLNLSALCLRPGFGAALDNHRVTRLWKLLLSGLAHPKSDACRLEWWIAQRRVAGGLTRGQQQQVQGRVRDLLLGQKAKRVPKQEGAELWRLVASLEHLDAKTKTRYGNALLDRLAGGKGPPRWGLWSLGRLGARAPVYGGIHEVVPIETAIRWVDRALELAAKESPRSRERAWHAVVTLARATGDPRRDLPTEVASRVARRLEALGADPTATRPILDVQPLARSEERLLFGDSIPTGFRLANG